MTIKLRFSVLALLLIVFSLCDVQENFGREALFTEVSLKQDFRAESVLGDHNHLIHANHMDNDGVYVRDYNRDLWPDVLTVGETRPLLYRNNQGVFERSKTFPVLDRKITAALWVDYDRNRWPDLLLVPLHGRIILLQNEQGTFKVDHRLDSPIVDFGMGATSGDFNRDGCPDVLVLQYGKVMDKAPSSVRNQRQGLTYKNLDSDNAHPNLLLEGDCETFHPVNNSILNRSHWSLAASFVDVNGDGYQDIHVANDFYRDSLYLNRNGKDFGHRYLNTNTHRNGMSSQVLNVHSEKDSPPDIFVSNIGKNPDSRILDNEIFLSAIPNPHGNNLLVLNDGTYRDRAGQYGLVGGGWAWASSWFNFDGDFLFEFFITQEDLVTDRSPIRMFNLKDFSVAEFISSNRSSPDISWTDYEDSKINEFRKWIGYPRLYQRRDTNFRRIPPEQTGFGRLNTRGVSPIDFDNDGDPDLVMSQFNDSYSLFRNNSPTNPQDWVKVKVRDAFVGGTLRVDRSDGRSLSLPVTSRTDFHSQEPAILHFGVGDGKSLESLSMQWNDHNQSVLSDVKGGQYVVIGFRKNRIVSLGALN